TGGENHPNHESNIGVSASDPAQLPIRPRRKTTAERSDHVPSKPKKEKHKEIKNKDSPTKQVAQVPRP
ncbi:unnamed protein product, partial [Amoebophrya sp. A120]